MIDIEGTELQPTQCNYWTIGRWFIAKDPECPEYRLSEITLMPNRVTLTLFADYSTLSEAIKAAKDMM